MYRLKQGYAFISTHQFRRPLLIVAITSLLAIFLVSLLRSRDGLFRLIPYPHIGGSASWAPEIAGANATLGFEKIFALTMGTPWRVKGLHAAANLTGLQIDLPIQPHTSQEDVEAFQQAGLPGQLTPSKGSTLAWLGHLNLLEHFLNGGWTTALIIEDDADWDIALREKIMPPLVKGVRYYTKALLNDTATTFGGNWDLIWMGHCGEWSHSDMPYFAWPDSTVVPHDEYVGWASVDMKARLPEGVRTTHPTTNSVCTFAYGVTADGARKIIEHVRTGEAFDVALSNACRENTLRCVTIHPEVFHQYSPAIKGDGETSEIALADHNASLSSVTVLETVKGSSPNIKNSAWCAALFNDTCQQKP